MPTLPVLDGEQLLDDLEQLARIGANPGGGLDRMAYSPADREGRAWVAARMQAAGLDTTVDAAGNTIARYPGQDENLAPIVLGSHTDTVPNGGRYDGALGVLAALACIRTLRDADITLRHPVEIINFAAEEATMAGATLGSRAMLGQLDVAVPRQLAWDGRPVREHLKAAGINPARLNQAQRAPGSMAAFLELHVEQGGTLEAAHVPIGVVEGIAGIRQYQVTFQGYANHAGTTRMADRRDALVMAAPLIPKVRDIAVAHNIVGTVGTLHVKPGAPNVIPGYVELSVEIRGLDTIVLDAAETQIKRTVRRISGQFERITTKPPTESDARLVEAIKESCKALHLAFQQMPSGAGHDAMVMAHLAPMAMIFVPSHNGVSHSPDEYTTPEHCVAGARVLLSTLLKLDAVLE